MKIKKILALFAIAISLTSCSDFLDVDPKTEIREDKMFNNESGYKEALIGSYMLMGTPTLYGRDMTVCMLDAMAGQYEMKSTNSYINAEKHRYDLLESSFSNMWLQQYKIIANVNALLGALEEKGKKVLHPTNYAIIKGEALGLRAFLHFDLLRLFGWGNLKADPSGLDRLTIPYVLRYHKSTTKQSTEAEVLELIHKDLKEADELLAYYDSYGAIAKRDDYELPNQDGFYSNRRNRFNYFAVRALKARVYMWEGKYQEALDIIKPTFIDEEPIRWVSADASINVEEKARDLSYTTEHIFNIDITSMYDALKAYTETYDIKSGFSMSQNDQYFYLTQANGELLYDIADGTGLSDYRYLRGLNKTDATAWLFLKFWESPESTSPGKNKMPLIRKPEMYYYAAECYNELGQTKKAIELINTVRMARGILYEKNLPETLSKEEIDAAIEKEWRKEYIGEGQMFFYYKRLGKPVPNATVSGDDLFVIPLPEKEVEIGGREDYGKTDIDKNN